jgi:hypothetical protein
MGRFVESLMGRRWLAWSILALAIVVTMLASVTVWVRREALDTNNWTTVSSRLLENKDVRQVIAADMVDALFTNTDVEAGLRATLPPRLDPLAAPATGLLREVAFNAADELLQRPAVQSLWAEANRRAHQRLIAILDGKGGTLTTADGGAVILDLRPMVDRLAQRLGVQAKIPPDAGRIEIMRSDQLSAAQDAVKLVRRLSVLAAILALALLALAVYVGRGFRWEVLRAIALSLLGVGVVLLVLRRLVGNAVIDSLTSAPTRSAGRATWLIGTGLLRDVAFGLISYGVVLLVGVLLAGPSGWATALRQRLAPAMRDHVALVYTAVGFLFLLFLLWGPASGSRRLVGVIVLAALVAGGVEVLRRQILRESSPASA